MNKHDNDDDNNNKSHPGKGIAVRNNYLDKTPLFPALAACWNGGPLVLVTDAF